MAARSIEPHLAKPVIPVLWDVGNHSELLAAASMVILQGGAIANIDDALAPFESPSLSSVAVFVHIDLVSGIENSEAGLEFLAKKPRIGGVVSVHHNLVRPAKRLGLCSVVRLFLTDSRAVDRGLSIAAKSHADAIEVMPTAAAARTAGDFAACRLPRIAGGLCRTEEELQEALSSGIRAVTSTRPSLWKLNQ